MKKIILIIGLIFMLGLSSAHNIKYKEKYTETHYYPKGHSILSKTTWTYYDNEKRHSTYHYRHGYSYRATNDYYKRKIIQYRRAPIERKIIQYRRIPIKREIILREEIVDYNKIDYDYDYYNYRSTLRHINGRDCYITPPADRLFYIAC